MFPMLGPRTSGSQFFFKNFFANLKQGIIQEEGAFSSEVAMLPSIFEIICSAVGIKKYYPDLVLFEKKPVDGNVGKNFFKKMQNSS